MFNNLRKATEEHKNARIARFAEDLKDLNAEQVVESWYYKQYTTPGTFEALKALPLGSPIPEDIARKMLKKYTREEEKHAAARLHDIEAAENAATISGGSIDITYKRSIDGLNPTATARGFNEWTTARAGGGGYHKPSAAIASALNKNPEFLRIIYQHADNGGAFPYEVTLFAGLPSFPGARGFEVLQKVFEACGYNFKHIVDHPKSDCFTIAPIEK